MARRAAGHTGSRKKEGFTDAGYVLFSVPADGRRHGLRADGRMRKAAAHGAAAGCAHLRADPSGAGRAGGVTPHGGERPSADRRAVHHAHERQLRRPRHPRLHAARRGGAPRPRRGGRAGLPALEGGDGHRFPAFDASVRAEGHGGLRAPRSAARQAGRERHGVVL